MTYEIFSSGPVSTNSVLLYKEQAPCVFLFDTPQGCVKHWVERLNKLKKNLTAIFFTHSHWDHIAEVALAKEIWNVPVGIHEDDVGNLIQPGSDGLPLPLDIEGVRPDFLIRGDEKRSYDNFVIDILHTPGHTPGSVCYYFSEFHLIITGDTLFRGAIGRLDFPTARPHLMKDSLKKILALPTETTVIPGHGKTTSIGQERNITYWSDSHTGLFRR